jgi:hypothetical protein
MFEYVASIEYFIFPQTILKAGGPARGADGGARPGPPAARARVAPRSSGSRNIPSRSGLAADRPLIFSIKVRK